MSGRPRLVCLFAQYHPRQRLREPVLHYIGALRACGYAVFVAAAGDRAPPDEDRGALEATGAVLLPRPNGGLDFGSWQFLIGEGCADGADRVLLANDSVFGPFFPLAPFIDRMEAGGYDVWGAIESRQESWHLQSWFLQFTGEAFRRPEIRRVFELPYASMTKGEVIVAGELGLGAAIEAAGLRWGALVRHRDATWLARRHRLNMMHLDWRHNLLRRRLPFLKAELLRDNPMRLPWTGAWDGALRGIGADPAPLHDYLYDYTGRMREKRDAPFRALVGGLKPRMLLGYTMATHDRATALRWILHPRDEMVERTTLPPFVV